MNPVLRRELLERFRAKRATVALTAYLAVLGLLLWILHRIGTAVLDSGMGFGVGPGPETAGPLLGRFLVEGLLFFVLLGVLFVTPGYAAGQIAGERERRTLPLLQVTLLHPHQIVLGKLGASTAWLLLLVIAAVPLGAAAFFLGGVAVGDLVRGTAFVLLVAVAVAGIAIGFSSLTKRTVGAVVLTYATVLALTVGTLFGALAEFIVRSSAGERERFVPVALYANPVFGLADAMRATPPSESFATGELLPSPLAIMAEALPRDEDDFGRARPMPVEPPPGEMRFEEPAPEVEEPADSGRRTWLAVGALYLALGAAGVGVATLRTRTTDLAARPRTRKGATPPPVRAGTPPDEPEPVPTSGWEAR